MSLTPDIQSRLAVVKRQYFQQVEPSQIRWLDDSLLKAPDIQSWLFDNLFKSERLQYPPPEQYQQRVLKLLISKIERSIDDPEEDEISDDLMSSLSLLFGSSLPSESAAAQQKAYVTYAYPLRSTSDKSLGDASVTLLESRAVISSSGTTGLRTWEAALLLGAYLTSTSGLALVRGKKVVELGAGTGMLSILCAKHLAVAGIVGTDGDEAVVDAIKTNAFLNGVDVSDSQDSIKTAALKWGWPIEAATFAEDYGMEAPDIVLGADVTYDRHVIPRLISTIREFFDLNSALQVLIAATIRNEETFETFLNACKRNRFSAELVDFQPVPEHLQDGPFFPTSTPIQIWRITMPLSSRDPFAL